MNRAALVQSIKEKKSFLCIGLDPDLDKMPQHLLETEDPVFEFNKQLIDATHDLCVAYKPNLAFYEQFGAKGLGSLAKTMDYIPDGIFTIADAKRGDIGNSSLMYARTFFEHYNFDSITISPYMGKDSVTPFLEYENKWTILLALTSNPGSNDFQQVAVNGDKALYEKVLIDAASWGTTENLMFVVGATRGEMIGQVRKSVPNHFLLVPGVGSQGGSLSEVAQYGMTDDCGLLVNSSRGIIYAGSDQGFAAASREAALAVQSDMESILSDRGLI